MKALYPGKKIEVFLILVAVTCSVRANLVGYWKFDETAGVVAEDHSGNGYDGILTGSQWDTGRFSGAIRFNGDGYVSVPKDVFSSIDKFITICFWQYGGPSQPIQASVLEGTDKDGNRILNVELPWGSREEMHWDACKRDGEELNAIRVTKKMNITNYKGRWNHWAFTKNIDTGIMNVYLNGKLWASGADRFKTIKGVTSFKIGSRVSENRKYDGWVDEFRIYDHALGPDEIARVYKYSSEPFCLVELINAVKESREILKKDGGAAAVKYLENQIAKSGKLNNELAKNYAQLHREINFDLFYYLAKAKEASGASAEVTAAIYDQALKQGCPTSQNSGYILLDLFEKGRINDFKNVINTLIENKIDYIASVIKAADSLLGPEKAEAVIGFIEENLKAYSNWRDKYQQGEIVVQNRLPELYFRLAEYQLKAGSAKKDISNSYRNTFGVSNYKYIPERSTAMLWMLRNDCVNEYTEAVKSFSAESEYPFTQIIISVCKDLDTDKEWSIFEKLLEVLFSNTTVSYEWNKTIEAALKEKSTESLKHYKRYFANKPKLQFKIDVGTADNLIDSEKFHEAAILYKSILDRCDPEEDKGILELKLCKSLFGVGEYRDASLRLEGFIKANKKTNRNLVRQAILLNGRCYVQLGELDKALDNFFTLLIEYPRTEEIPETNFLAGYCYMLQGDFQEAIEVFECLIKTYPESTYSYKARNYLSRLDIAGQ